MRDKNSILLEIKRSFANYKEGQPVKKRRYPEALQRLACEALKEDVRLKDVCQAAGVTAKSVRAWQRGEWQERSLQAKELKVTSRRDVTESQCGGSDTSRAELHFGEKLQLSLPLSAVNMEFLRQLSKLGGEL